MVIRAKLQVAANVREILLAERCIPNIPEPRPSKGRAAWLVSKPLRGYFTSVRSFQPVKLPMIDASDHLAGSQRRIFLPGLLKDNQSNKKPGF